MKAEQGDVTKQRLLGMYYQHGMGIEENAMYAYMWTTIALHAGEVSDTEDRLERLKADMPIDDIENAEVVAQKWISLKMMNGT